MYLQLFYLSIIFSFYSECKNTKKSRYDFRNLIFFIKTEPLSVFFKISSLFLTFQSGAYTHITPTDRYPPPAEVTYPLWIVL